MVIESATYSTIRSAPSVSWPKPIPAAAKVLFAALLGDKPELSIEASVSVTFTNAIWYNHSAMLSVVSAVAIASPTVKNTSSIPNPSEPTVKFTSPLFVAPIRNVPLLPNPRSA